jgi:hypothetical protein
MAVLTGGSLTELAFDVDAGAYWLEMEWIDAGRVLTKVIDHISRRDWSDQPFVSDAVSLFADLVLADLSIASRGSIPGPEPAFRALVYFGPETEFECGLIDNPRFEELADLTFALDAAAHGVSSTRTAASAAAAICFAFHVPTGDEICSSASEVGSSTRSAFIRAPRLSQDHG